MMGAVASGAFANGGKITSIAPRWIGQFDDEFENATEYIITDLSKGVEQGYIDLKYPQDRIDY